MNIATIISGELDAADVLFLIAVILFTIAAVLEFAGRSVPGLTTAGLACTALALLVL